MDSINKVCISGGTHGNELSGVYLVKKWQQDPEFLKRPTFETKTLISNPASIKANRRYIDVDLNRSFSRENLSAKITETTPYEIKRAQEVYARLSEGGDIGPCDLLLDLHNTTANTRVCLIYSSHENFILHLVSYVSSQFPKGSCYCLYRATDHDISSLSKHGIALEVGPQPQGVLRADIYNQQEEAVKHCLDFVEKYNKGVQFEETSLEWYEEPYAVNKYPRDDKGEINGIVHQSIQDKDWSPLSADDPVLQMFDGRILTLKDVIDQGVIESKAVFPVFVNEASYYEKGIAFRLAKKMTTCVPKLVKS